MRNRDEVREVLLPSQPVNAAIEDGHLLVLTSELKLYDLDADAREVEDKALAGLKELGCLVRCVL